jgi:hypothetical protein
MTQHAEQTASQPGPVPARIELEDFIEAVTRGVARALAAQVDVSGYLAQTNEAAGRPVPAGSGVRPITILAGIFAYPPPSWPPYEVALGAGSVAKEG